MDEIRVRTTVLAGGKIEVSIPELEAGEVVDVHVVPAESAEIPGVSAIEFLEGLPPGPRSSDSWEEIERFLKAERDSWDR